MLKNIKYWYMTSYKAYGYVIVHTTVVHITVNIMKQLFQNFS